MAGEPEFSFDDNQDGPSQADGGTGNLPGSQGAGGSDDGVTSRSPVNEVWGSRPVTKTRTGQRGRPRLPRDAAGNIIRDGTASTGPKTQGENPAKKPGLFGGKAGEKLAVDNGKNDRGILRNNIQGMHAALATVTKQPVFMLTDQEAVSLTDALATVLDLHNINITKPAGPAAAYVTLGLVGFMIYKPRLDYIRRGGGQQIEQPPAAPATPGAVPPDNVRPYDFSGMA